MTTLALAGDTMLGRLVGEHLTRHPARSLVDDALIDIVSSTDGMLLNLECCISARGAPWPGRRFHFSAPPVAVDVLTMLGVRAVTLANNHACDYGPDALLDTLLHLDRAGIAHAGAGADLESARAPARFEVGRDVVTLVSFSDHPAEYAAGADRPGIAHVDLAERLPAWVSALVRSERGTDDLLVVSPHWGPNMVDGPRGYVRRAAAALVEAGADVVAGHSAHVFHGVEGRVLFDLGDFVDDYATGPLRNDLGLLWLLTTDRSGPSRVEAVPLHLGCCRTEVATGEDALWVRDRLIEACRSLGTELTPADGRLVVDLRHR